MYVMLGPGIHSVAKTSTQQSNNSYISYSKYGVLVILATMENHSRLDSGSIFLCTAIGDSVLVLLLMPQYDKLDKL